MESKLLFLREGRDRQLRFQLDSGREHPRRDTSSSETGPCYGQIDEWYRHGCVQSPVGYVWVCTGKRTGTLRMHTRPHGGGGGGGGQHNEGCSTARVYTN
eukprot:gene26097-biopygen13882